LVAQALEKYVESPRAKAREDWAQGRATPHIREGPIRRKMVNSTFFAERGLL